MPLAVSSYLDVLAGNGAQAIFLPLFSDIAVLSKITFVMDDKYVYQSKHFETQMAKLLIH